MGCEGCIRVDEAVAVTCAAVGVVVHLSGGEAGGRAEADAPAAAAAPFTITRRRQHACRPFHLPVVSPGGYILCHVLSSPLSRQLAVSGHASVLTMQSAGCIAGQDESSNDNRVWLRLLLPLSVQFHHTGGLLSGYTDTCQH